MSKILIENYRGFDIEFDTQYEKFQCVCTEESAKESSSFTAIKKFIDDYKKNNQDFKPFWVEPTPNAYKDKKLKVIGIRKDGRLVGENSKGEKEQISDYSMSDYMLIKEENKTLLNQLKELDIVKEQERLKHNEARNEIISKLTIVTLKEHAKSLK